MNDELKAKIEKVRFELQKQPSAMIIGKLNEGINSTETIVLKSYCDFLNVCNGAYCGAIDLWSNALIVNNQYKVAELAGGNEKWLCIGQVIYEPLVVKLDTEELYLFYQGHENEMEGKCFGELDIFLNDYVFGKKYAEIVPDAEKDDEWYIFLKKINLI